MSSASAPALAHRAHSRPFLPPARPAACGLHARPRAGGLPRRRVVRGDRPAWQGDRRPQQAPLCPPKASRPAAALLHTPARPDGPGVVRLRLEGSPPACAQRANVGAHCLPDAAPLRPFAPSAADSTASPRGRCQGGGGRLQAQRGLGGGSSWRVLVCGRGWSPCFWVTGARPGQSLRRHPPATASVDGRVLGRHSLAEHQRAGWRPLPQVLGAGEFTAHHTLPRLRSCSGTKPLEGSGGKGAPVPEVMPSDVRTLVNGFAKNPLQTRREGLYFKEKDYRCVRADEYSLYAKNENTGVVVVKTHLYLLVATYTEGMYPSVCVEATESLGDYLRKKGS
ncbi:profilin-4 isoform X2 [Trachypithecus francoisi]|uniref:profilin-4 isoform X2 n=1 Tax=Trachypithecus francoisi TaxID=54180 RepID=UPI00141BC78F|nr:profilin-4 isoform X2 [Trachypithecus francoisi]